MILGHKYSSCLLSLNDLASDHYHTSQENFRERILVFVSSGSGSGLTAITLGQIAKLSDDRFFIRPNTCGVS